MNMMTSWFLPDLLTARAHIVLCAHTRTTLTGKGGRVPRPPTPYQMDKMMGTLFRLLCRHLRTIWLRARSLFYSIRLRLLRINPTPSPSIAHISRPSPPMPTSSSASRIPTITTFSTAMTKACQWAGTRARNLKAQITERRVAGKNMMKQMGYARMAVPGVGSVKKDEGNGVVATSKYCAKAIEDDDDDDDDDEVDEEDEEEGNRVGTEAQSNGDDVDVFESLFKPLSSSPTLRFVPSYCPDSPFPPSPSLASIPQNVNKLFIWLVTPSHVTPTVS